MTQTIRDGYNSHPRVGSGGYLADARVVHEASRAVGRQRVPHPNLALHATGGQELRVQAAHWNQNLALTAADMTTACHSLLERTLQAFRGALDAAADLGQLRAAIVTDSAARLPGFIPAL